ncbi:MAG: sugar transferase [Deltaproteobacteria bacterium]|nr:sugar transferase [Deltaproteobacteria bacterium]
MLKEQEKYLFQVFLLFDFLSVLFAYIVSAPLSLSLMDLLSIHKTMGSSLNYDLSSAWNDSILLLPFLLICSLLFLNLFGSLRPAGFQGVRAIILRTGISCLFSWVIMSILTFFYGSSENVIGFLLTFFFILWIFLAFGRLCLYFSGRNQSPSEFIRHVLIIGANDNVFKIGEVLDNRWVKVIGILADNDTSLGGMVHGHPILGRVKDLDSILEKHIVDIALLADGSWDTDQIHRLARHCDTVGLDFAFTSPEIKNKLGGHLKETTDENHFFLIKSIRRSPRQALLKRLIDFLVSAFLIVLSLPLWVIIPVLIKRDSPGPALFRQERIGKNGRRFVMYKFRSMVHDAEDRLESLMSLNEVDGPAFKMKGDPRITRIGKILRRMSLDELPQLLNVLKGDMSLVGPRPPIFEEVLQYQTWERKRLSVVPGITCFWQVSGRSELKFNEWMKLDMQYIDNWSLILDLKILIMTISAVLSSRGAQ